MIFQSMEPAIPVKIWENGSMTNASMRLFDRQLKLMCSPRGGMRVSRENNLITCFFRSVVVASSDRQKCTAMSSHDATDRRRVDAMTGRGRNSRQAAILLENRKAVDTYDGQRRHDQKKCPTT